MRLFYRRNIKKGLAIGLEILIFLLIYFEIRLIVSNSKSKNQHKKLVIVPVDKYMEEIRKSLKPDQILKPKKNDRRSQKGENIDNYVRRVMETTTKENDFYRRLANLIPTHINVPDPIQHNTHLLQGQLIITECLKILSQAKSDALKQIISREMAENQKFFVKKGVQYQRSQNIEKLETPKFSKLELCPPVSPLITGQKADLTMSISAYLIRLWIVFTNLFDNKKIISSQDTENRQLLGGGKPLSCISRHKVAIIIPYRNRAKQLSAILGYLHDHLQKQQIHFQIFVVEQNGNGTFNKAALMNAAFLDVYLKAKIKFHCFIFHDVDLVPLDDRLLYTCPNKPRHLAVRVDTLNYKLPYDNLIGGVLVIKPQHFISVNGFSNLFWGWGGEDDDLAIRFKVMGLQIVRPPPSIAVYQMLRHVKRRPIKSYKRRVLLQMTKIKMDLDGLNTISYTRVKIRHLKFYTHLLIDIGKIPTKF